MIRITYAKLAERARGRPGGYAEDVISRADKSDEDAIYLQPAAWMDLMAKYDPDGWGTRLHKIATPIARFSDAHLGTNLQNCPGCAERMERWNPGCDKPAA